MLNYYIMILCNAITTVTQLPCALHKESFYTKSAAGRETNMNEENRITLILIDTCAFTRKYLEKHPNDILLVISKDSDWTTAFNQIFSSLDLLMKATM